MMSLIKKKRALNQLLRVTTNEVKKSQKPWRFLKKKRFSDARWKVKSSFDGYRKKLRKRVKQLKLSRLNIRRFEALTGYRPMDGELRHSDIPARRKFAMLVAREIHHLHRNDPDLKFLFLTLLADEGITSDRRPICYVEQLIDKARRAMMTLGVDGITAIEVTPLMNYPQRGRGRSILLHVHMLIWYSPKHQHEPQPVRDLWPDRGIRAWTCKFGADPIRVTEITPDMGTPAYWAAYMLKGPHEAKNRIPKKDSRTSDEFKLMTTIQGYRPELAMRLHEFSSCIPLTSLSLGTKGGATILRRCRKHLNRWAKTRKYVYPEPTKPFDEKAWWERSHRFRRKRYRPFFIFGPTID